MRWEARPLAEVADFCLGKMLDEKKNRGDLMPYLANINVRWGEFEFDNLREMRFEQHELERYGLKYGDIVMCEGGEPGRCAIWKDQVPGMMIQKALHRIRSRDCLDASFLFYSFLNKGMTGRFASLFTGSTIKHLPREKLALIEVEIPPRDAQHRISDILSSYDDLITNNKRRIELLEQSAWLLFKEWFVHLRYPGYEHDEVVDGVPEGWTKGTIADLGKVVTGKTPSKAVHENFGGDVPFIKTPDLHDAAIVIECSEMLSERGAQTQANKFIPPLSTMVSCIGSVGVVAMNATIAQTNQQINTIIPGNPHLTFFNFFFAQSLKARLEGLGGGATMANVNKGKFESLSCIIPREALLISFDEFCRPVFDMVLSLKKQSRDAVRARDLLLPRLMDGRLSV